MSDFRDFFPDGEDYPVSRTFPDELLPFGTEYSYVSSSFINGFINCGTLVAATMLNRYRAMDEAFDEPRTAGAITYRSKRELLDKLRDGLAPYHTKVGAFEGDVLLLKRLESPEGAASYLYIWCDCDVSDCSIGRFRTDLPEDEVIRLFHAHASDIAKCGDHPAGPVPLDLRWFRGWLSF